MLFAQKTKENVIVKRNDLEIQVQLFHDFICPAETPFGNLPVRLALTQMNHFK